MKELIYILKKGYYIQFESIDKISVCNIVLTNPRKPDLPFGSKFILHEVLGKDYKIKDIFKNIKKQIDKYEPAKSDLFAK